MTTTPRWQAHSASDYDRVMGARCGELLIVADADRRQAILADPRDLHRELFAPFAPSTHTYYAGTCRGAPGTALADRRMYAASQIDLGTEYEFCLPGEVPPRMVELLKNTHALLGEGSADDYGKLVALTYTFYWFGKIHPFLDYNGHIQRAIFAAMATNFCYALSPRFAIHPRPFDRLLALALEIFTRAPAGKENEELGLVAEYLAFFLMVRSTSRASTSRQCHRIGKLQCRKKHSTDDFVLAISETRQAGALLERAVGGSRLRRRGQHSRSCSNVGRLVCPFETLSVQGDRIGAGAAANAVSPIDCYGMPVRPVRSSCRTW